MSSPSMVQRSGDTLIVRSVVSGDRLFMDVKQPPGVVISHPALNFQPIAPAPPPVLLLSQQASHKPLPPPEYLEQQTDDDLPQCKIKRNYNCVHDNCDFFTQNPRHYLLHIRDVHDEKVKIYDCPNCLYASRHFQKLLRHMKMVHGSAEQLEMQNASKLNTSENDSEKHEMERKKVEPETKPKTLHKCSVCPFTTVHPGQLTRHERKDHVKTKFFSCEKCNYVTHIKARFTKHVKYHSMPMIKCEVCDFKTPYKWNLDRHMKNHGGTGAFYCSACNFTADIKQSLTVHEMNHHVPPAGQGGSSSGGTGNRRRNKVGGSDSLVSAEPSNTTLTPSQQPHLMDSDQDNSTGDSMQSMDEISEDSSERNMLMLSHEANEDAMYSKGEQRYQFSMQDDSNSKDNTTNFISKLRTDNEDSSSSQQKKLPRPIPNLIPLQTNQQQKSSSPSNGPLNLSVLSKQSEDKHVDGVKVPSMSTLCGSAYTDDSNDNINSDNLSIRGSDDSSQQSVNVSTKTIFKKKNASFFDKLKEKLMTTSVESGNLSCNNCGHLSKCLSEHSQHEKACNGDGKSNSSNLFSSGHGSTRCQYCRHRCKSSLDLVIHMQSCTMAGSKGRDSPIQVFKQEKIEIPINPESEEEASIDDPQAPHPMENVVFVWNSMLQNSNQPSYETNVDTQNVEEREPPHANTQREVVQNNTNSVTTTPGKTEPEPTASNSNNAEGKKVFKCPHCAFWASTASRFHVHIVGHLNKKPFECSLCSYRSNWRWDITKHIRLKSVRDPDHSEAKVLMTDETGRRNYTKYNKYITVMHASAATSELPPSGGKKKELKNIIKDITENLAVEKRIAPTYPNTNNYNDFSQSLLNIPQPFQKDSLAEEIKMSFPDDPDNKKTKKSMWKCKRCSYRNTSREALLIHVKKHTKPNSNVLSPQEPKKDSPATSENGDALGNQTYRCGHCYQVSNWKHVIQRHCRLKHNGDVKVLPGEASETPSPPNTSVIKLPSPKPASYENGKCSKCPFTCDNIEKLDQHSKRHVMSPDSIYKCFICSYYVNAEFELLEHLPLHGITNPEQYIAGIIQAAKPNTESTGVKRYQCVDCPYETNSKSQFMYHEQFHKSNDNAFKCDVCNYQVSKRHLLHQHMKVHGIINHKDITDYMAEIEPNNDTPLLWVNHDDGIRKMYKCSYCPFVNEEKTMLVDHEKMHVLKDMMHNLDHMNECPNCSFICDNMREFWMHTDVHKEDYATVICNVDPSKSDEEQLEHIRNIMETSVTPINADRKPRLMEEYNPNQGMQKHNKQSPSSNKNKQENNVFKVSNSYIGQQMTLLKEMLSTPINSNDNGSSMNSTNHSMNDSISDLNNSANITQKERKPERMLHFCSHCPARFTIEREYGIHMKFHVNRLPYQCKVCSYTARQQSHLMTHNTVHGREYQKKTRALQITLPTHPDHTQPNVVMIVSGMNISEPVWIVVEHGKTGEDYVAEDIKLPDPPVYKPMPKHFLCTLCPAKFFKNAALHYHLSLHGGTGQFKCKQCNYSVKTIGNLVKHESVHSDVTVEKPPKPAKHANKNRSNDFDSGDEMSSYKNIPLSGTDLFQHKTEVEKKAKTEKKRDDSKLIPKPNDHFPPVLQPDPQFGLLMHGNPDFIYPTYLKNGRQKEKRYKCHKCPSAFEKREQYKVHLSLHGSKQRYKCELCDYSVKYYANYVQHMRKHQLNADAHAARNNNASSSDIMDDIGTPKNISFAIKTLPKHIQKDTPKLSMSEQQTLKLSARRRSSAASGKDLSEEKKTFRCLYCPYINLRRDALDNHMRRHKAVSGTGSNFECMHCDYTAPQSHILREHLKFHFNNPKHTTPDFYSNYDSLELYVSKIDADTSKPGRRSCVFKSKRKANDQLLIPIKKKKIYVMPGSGEQVK